MTPSDETSQLLARWSAGDQQALGLLVPQVYGQLRRLARAQLRRERPDHTLETSALIHEAFLRLAGQPLSHCRHRPQFFAIAARVMRRILVEHARRVGAEKRGGDVLHVPFDDHAPGSFALDPRLLDLEEALDALAVVAPDQAQVVELRYFGGLRGEEIAETLGISVPTVTRRWRLARAWMYRFLSAGDAGEAPPAD